MAKDELWVQTLSTEPSAVIIRRQKRSSKRDPPLMGVTKTLFDLRNIVVSMEYKVQCYLHVLRHIVS